MQTTFTYDASGVPLTYTYNGMLFYCQYDAFGNLRYMADEDGVIRASYYNCDPWGEEVIAYTGSLEYVYVFHYCPLRYKAGYCYDYETGLYYLQSRYYNL